MCTQGGEIAIAAPWVHTRSDSEPASECVGRGKKVVVFDMKKAPPDDETLLAHVLGPTGNLKAPTLRLGDTLLVGFSEAAYNQVLGT